MGGEASDVGADRERPCLTRAAAHHHDTRKRCYALREQKGAVCTVSLACGTQGTRAFFISLFYQTLSTISARVILCSFTATSCPEADRPWPLGAFSPLMIVRVAMLPGLSVPTNSFWKFSGDTGCPSTFKIVSPRPRARLL